MKLAGAVIVVLALCAGLPGELLAQGHDRSVERVSAALQGQPRLGSGVFTWTEPAPVRLGILTLVPPVHRGEIVRVRLPIGELVSAAAHRISTANQRRREAAARQEVQRALSACVARRGTR